MKRICFAPIRRREQGATPFGTDKLRPLCAERRSGRGSAYQLCRQHFDGSTGSCGSRLDGQTAEHIALDLPFEMAVSIN